MTAHTLYLGYRALGIRFAMAVVTAWVLWARPDPVVRASGLPAAAAVPGRLP